MSGSCESRQGWDAAAARQVIIARGWESFGTSMFGGFQSLKLSLNGHNNLLKLQT